ncbi:MAG TPA: tryptophan 2,3-dioxygenase family protein [Micromonosporaceae bacterium]
MPKDYSIPVLDGPGNNDYARYMRTDELLALQRDPDEMIHPDELLFQTVHQSTELWLKLCCHEVEQATDHLRSGAFDTAARLLGRAALGVEFVTGQLEMLRHLSPWTFQTLRTVLGNGSGFESPGWRAVQLVSRTLDNVFSTALAGAGVTLVDIYRGSPDAPLHRLAEAMVDWDERVAVWRTRHYKVATRIIGHQSVGTKGAPVDVLAKLIAQKFFPQLWQVRTELTNAGPLADNPVDERSPLVREAMGTTA